MGLKGLWRGSFYLLAVVFLWLCFLPLSVGAQTAEEHFQSAQKAFAEERYGEALESIERAIEGNPEELEYRYFLALILIKKGRSEEAVDILKGLIERDERRYGKAYFDLMGVYLAQKREREALAVLEKAEKVDKERALLEQGYVLLSASEFKKAIQRFEQLRQTPRFSQSASYNLGIAYHREFDYKKALSYAEEAVELDPETGIAQNARFLIDAIKREMKFRRPFSLLLSSTSRYDDNVILQPLEQGGLQQLGIPPSRQGDYAALLTVNIGYKPVMRRSWHLSLEANFFQFFYAKLTRNNLTAFMPAARLSFFVSPVVLRSSYSFGRFVVHNDPYAHVHSVSQVVSVSMGRVARADVMVQADFRRYLDGLTPDADHYVFGYAQFFSLGSLEPRLGYKYEIEDNKKNKGDFFSHEFLAGLTTPFIMKTYLSLSYSYLARKFKLTEAISLTTRRKDTQHFIYVVLSKRLGHYFSVNVDLGQTFSRSNIGVFLPDAAIFDPYHWRKNIVSLTLTFTY